MQGVRRRAALGLTATLIASSAAVFGMNGRVLGAQALSVTIDQSATGASVPSTALGLNTAVWDSHLQDNAIPGMLQNAGVKLLRFPGGSTSDAYHWQSNSMTPGQGGSSNSANTFDRFMQNVVRPAGAQAMITVNYGSNAAGNGGGDPSEAAAWVNYANNVQHYGVKYWEIGNEVYGNGYYGAKWETDLHADHSPTAYAQNVLAYVNAMKAVDPTIKVGVVLTAPGNWPDGAGPQAWNNTVLSLVAGSVDFVAVHWYAQTPGQESDAGLLGSTASIGSMVSSVRSLLSQYAGSRASSIGIMITENNSVSYNPGKQTTTPINGLFLMQNYLEWLKAGVQNVDWWDLHNNAESGNNNSSSLVGSTGYGDYGVLSSGGAGEPAADSPLPAYTALRLLSGAVVPGATFLGSSTSDGTVHTYALREPNGSDALVLVNDSASNTYSVAPHLSSGAAWTSAQITSFGLSSLSAVTSTLPIVGGATSFTLAPYSAAVVQLGLGTASAVPTATSAPAISTPKPTMTPAVPTSTPVPAPSTGGSLLGNFEGGTDGFNATSNVTAMGPSTWTPTVALGSSALWVQYAVPSAWAEAQISKAVNTTLSGYTTLSASVYPKQPLAAAGGIKVRFMVQGSDSNWYASPYTTVPVNARSNVSWNMAGVPRSPMKTVFVCWQFTTANTAVGNEMWVDDVQASGTTATSLLSSLRTTAAHAFATLQGSL
jgi:hypothetical protein